MFSKYIAGIPATASLISSAHYIRCGIHAADFRNADTQRTISEGTDHQVKEFNLNRFLDAQNASYDGYEQALEETHEER